jgi:hypothetical protein
MRATHDPPVTITNYCSQEEVMENLLPTMKSISDLVRDFELGNIAVPEIQRDVVWGADKVKDLIDSISRSYPCGSLILWEPREKDHALVRSMVRPERLKAAGTKLPRYFLLDGQQRLTSLASVFLPREKLKELLAELEEEMPFIFVNLRQFPNDIQATTDFGRYSYPWIAFHRLFDNTLPLDKEYAALSPEIREKIQQYVQRFRDYTFPVQIIRDRTYDAVADIFTRVNSQGTQLTGAEIHLARIVPHWRGITKEFRNYRQLLRQKNYDLDLTFLIRAITVVECKVPRIKNLAERVSKEKPPRKQLDRSWKLAKKATDKLIEGLKNNLLLDKSKFFTSKNALVPLIYYLAEEKRNPSQKDIQRFFLLSQVSEHYGRAAETTLNRDFRTLREVSPREGLSNLVSLVDKEARQEYRGLKVRADQVSGPQSKNVLVLLMYILMRRAGATEWGPGNNRSLDEIEPSDLHLHHIFPFNFMVANKEGQARFGSVGEYRSEINDIANLTFLGKEKNSSISDDPPWVYLPNETDKETRKAHFIPEDKSLWKPDKFPEFLDARRALLAKAITRLLKS